MLKLTSIFLLMTSLAANAEWLQIYEKYAGSEYRLYVETNSVRLTKTGSIAEFLTEFDAPEGTLSVKALEEYNCTTYASRRLAYMSTNGHMGKGEVRELSNDILEWSTGGTDLSSVDGKMRFACSEAKKYAKTSTPHKRRYYTLNGEPFEPNKWIRFGGGEHVNIYVDISSMKPTHDGLQIRILSDFKTPVDPNKEMYPSQGLPFNSSIVVTDYNCSTNQKREVKHTYFSDKLGGGFINNIHGEINGWSDIEGNGQLILSQHLIACTVLRDVATGALKSIPPDFNFDDKHDQQKHKEPASQQI